MEKLVLKKDITDLLRKDPALSGRVADFIKCSLSYFPKLLAKNDKGEKTELTDYNTLLFLSKEMGVQNIDDLVTAQTVEEKLTNE